MAVLCACLIVCWKEIAQTLQGKGKKKCKVLVNPYMRLTLVKGNKEMVIEDHVYGKTGEFLIHA